MLQYQLLKKYLFINTVHLEEALGESNCVRNAMPTKDLILRSNIFHRNKISQSQEQSPSEWAYCSSFEMTGTVEESLEMTG
jgi:hypothetical protein